MGRKSQTLFLITGTGSFLSHDVSLWSEDPDFLKFKEVAVHLKVVNDAAERGVKLLSDYLNILTRDDEQRDKILQVVQYHRKKMKKGDKSDYFSNF